MDVTTPQKRRRRDTPQPDGKITAPSERDLIWFRFIADHAGRDEGLPTSFLHALTEDRWTCRAKAQDRLKDLYHQHSIHGEHYLDREDDHSTPERCYEAIHKLTSSSIKALEEDGYVLQKRDIKQRRGSHPTSPHQSMVAACGGSLEIAVHKHPALEWISERELLADTPSHSARFPCEITDRGQFSDRAVIPDRLFQLKYLEERPSWRLFAVECDRSNEPWSRKDLEETSYRAKYLRYAEIIRGQRFSYKTHLNKRAGMVVLNIMSNAAHMQYVKGRLLDEFGPCRWMLFKFVPGFGKTLFVPKPMYQLLHEPWERAGYPPLDITNSLDPA